MGAIAEKKTCHVAGLAALGALSAVTASCAGITLGEGTQNDPVPQGTIVAQGPFQGYNGRTVTGNVSVYQQTTGGATCTFVVRLASLSAPSDAGLEVIPSVNGAPSLSPSFYALRAPTGNENYIFSGAPCGASWAQIQITNPAIAPTSAQTYGIANLTAVGG